MISAKTKNADSLAARIAEKLGVETTVLNNEVRVEQRNGHSFITRLVEAFPGEIESVTLSKPTLEDVFIVKTGRRLNSDG